MTSDLLAVQKAANEAHTNFLAATKLDSRAHQKLLASYVDEFLSERVKRSVTVRHLAENAKSQALTFPGSLVDIQIAVSNILLERDFLVNCASMESVDIMIRRTNDFLGRINAKLKREKGSDKLPNEIYETSEIEKIQENAANLGYAVALVEQLSANMIVERLEELNTFCQEYLHTKTVAEVISELRSEDIVEILSVVVTKFVEHVSLLSTFRKPFEFFDKRQKRKAGVRPGDTDIMIELGEILARYATATDKIATALKEAKIYADTLAASVRVAPLS